MRKDSKTTSAIEVMADLCGIPRRKLAKGIEALKNNKRTIWVIKEPKSGYYLFYSHYNPFRRCKIGDIDTLLFGNGLMYANTRKELEEWVEMPSIKCFANETGFKLKPVRITVEIKEG